MAAQLFHILFKLAAASPPFIIIIIIKISLQNRTRKKHTKGHFTHETVSP